MGNLWHLQGYTNSFVTWKLFLSLLCLQPFLSYGEAHCHMSSMPHMWSLANWEGEEIRIIVEKNDSLKEKNWLKFPDPQNLIPCLGKATVLWCKYLSQGLISKADSRPGCLGFALLLFITALFVCLWHIEISPRCDIMLCSHKLIYIFLVTPRVTFRFWSLQDLGLWCHSKRWFQLE